MATLRIPDEDRTLTEFSEIKKYLADIGIGYEIWKPSVEIDRDSSNEQILEAFAGEIETLKQQGGYQTADVINLFPDTPNLEPMLARFSKEHWHDEDEIRFITAGRGVFHIRPEGRFTGGGSDR